MYKYANLIQIHKYMFLLVEVIVWIIINALMIHVNMDPSLILK